MQESIKLFANLIAEKHNSLKSKTDSLVQSLTSEDAALKLKSAEETMNLAKIMIDSLSNQDTPSWLKTMYHTLNIFCKEKRISAYELLRRILPEKQSMDSHLWNFENKSVSAFDFDGIYEHFKKESKLNELFDAIIKIIEEIKNSGEVDSLSMLKSLDKVIAAIKKGMHGSYFSMESTWRFFMSFMKHYMLAELSNIPALGSFVEAMKNTIDETNAELSKVHQNIKNEMQRIAVQEINELKDKPTIDFMTYHKHGKLSGI